MSSETFEYKADELTSLLKKIRQKVESHQQSSYGEEKKAFLRDVKQSLGDADELTSELGVEMRKAPLSYRAELMKIMRQHKKDVDALHREVKKLESEPTQGGMLVDIEGEFAQTESSQRTQLFQGTQSLNRASDSIARSHRVAAETDMIGTDIIDELGTQREQLVRTRDRLTDTDENLSKSRKVLRSMARRMMTNKLIIIVIIVLEVIILGGVVYWKFFS